MLAWASREVGTSRPSRSGHVANAGRAVVVWVKLSTTIGDTARPCDGCERECGSG